MAGCSLFLALAATVVAVVAISVAFSTRKELRELRSMLAQGLIRVPPAAQQPAAQRQSPSQISEQQQPLPSENAAPPPPSTLSPETARGSSTVPPQHLPHVSAGAPEPASPVPPPTPQPVPSSPSKAAIDWENLVGIKLFGWIAGIALVLAAVFLFKYSVEHGWLRPSIRASFGLLTGAGLLVVCELRIARNYRVTANAMDGAGIAILYATLFALHARWHLWPPTAAFLGMLVVTAVAVLLSTRRDSIFIALLGLLGGFATPALLSSGENRPIALFSYLLLLNGGISWIAFRKRWPLLTALSVGLTAFYQWTWVHDFLSRSQLPLAAAIFLVFAAFAAVSFWRELEFRRIGAAAAVLPLLFAFFTAIVPEYGASYNVLFGFLLLLAAGLAAIAMLRGAAWLHSLGGAAALITFFLWLTASYTKESWPLSVVWLAAFIALYLAASLRLETIALYTAPLLFFVFFGLALRETSHAVTLTGAMFALLAIVAAFSFLRSKPFVATIAIALSSATLMTAQHLPSPAILIGQPVLLALLLCVAAAFEKHELAAGAVLFTFAAQVAAEDLPSREQLALCIALYALFVLYPLLLGPRIKHRIAPHLAAILASISFFLSVYELRTPLGFARYAGVLPLAEALVLIVLLLRLLPLETQPGRLALVAAAALAFLTAAIPVQLEKEWMTLAFSLEAAALAWLFTRISHRGLLWWSGGLATVVLVRLVLNPAVYAYHPKSATPVFNWYLYTYLFSALAMFALAWLVPKDERVLRRLACAFGAVELFVLLNIEIADYYSKGTTLAFNFMGSSLAQDLTYTIGWAVFAMATLIAGLALHSRGVRVAALGLLFVTVLKCFLHDLGRLGGLYRVASLFGLAVSLVLVGLLLQKFVILRREEPAATP